MSWLGDMVGDLFGDDPVEDNVPGDTELDPEALRRAGMWWCGGCDSCIPIGYWHTCTEDDTRSGPAGTRIPDQPQDKDTRT